MDNIQYIGENLLIGKIGHFFIALSFVASILAAVSYFFAEKRKDLQEGIVWKKMARFAFLAHGISVFMVIGLIFYIMTDKMYEYAYAFNHVSDDLNYSYILAAFWEGQEGSFLLWMFWHVILGIILLAKTKEWENGVMMFLSIIQAIISSFLLGIYIVNTRIGINPFVLLRDTKEAINAPIFSTADYLTQITGTGLNPLLQNYWMTIHPPTLFLGFASVSVPFCFAAAALWRKEYKSWLKPVLPWALFSGTILGTGILMGGAWAYEALSFGGYWAWDPVENMSLVPWLILLAGIHMNVVAKATGHSIKATLAFYLFSFILVFYSTFLTRSGVLGDTSVHAFTELGLEWHLVLGLFSFIGIAFYLYFKNNKHIPEPEKEEPFSSKEFWMFIGSLVLLISTLLISISTSIPVFNKLMDGAAWVLNSDFSNNHLAPPSDAIEHYNKYQLWVALLIGILSGAAQFLRYKESNFEAWKKVFSKHIIISSVLSLILTYLFARILDTHVWQYYVLSFGCWFAVVSNIDYLITTIRTNIKLVGSVFSHVGFGLMILGSIISGLNQHHISTDSFGQKGIIEGFTEEDYNKNILLIKDKPLFMNGYKVTYEKDSINGVYRTFTINYQKIDLKTGEISENFNLYPNIIYEKTFQKVAASNPSTKHYLGKDIFTHIASLPRAETDPEYARSQEDSLGYISYSALLKDTFHTPNLIVEFVGIETKPTHESYTYEEGDMGLGIRLKVTDKKTNKTFDAMPFAVIRRSRIIRFPAELTEINAKLKLTTKVFDEYFVNDSELDYKSYTLKKGDSFHHLGTTYTFSGFETNPTSEYYFPQKDDIAMNAMIRFEKQGKDYTAKPIYVIRDNIPFNIKDEFKDLGLHFKIGNVDAKNQNITIVVAQGEPKEDRVTIQVAEDVPSSQYVVLEAIVFPGINLFWFGSVLMLLGIFVAMWRRIKER